MEDDDAFSEEASGREASEKVDKSSKGEGSDTAGINNEEDDGGSSQEE